MRKLLINLFDFIIRFLALAIFIYIVYHKTQQQIIAIICLVVCIIGVRRINEYVSILIEKFRLSKKGVFPFIGDYELAEDTRKEAEAPVTLRKIEYESTVDLNRAERFNNAIRNAARFSMIGQWIVVVKYIEEALQITPDDNNLRLQLSIIYGERLGDKERAIYHCNEVLKRDAKNISAKFNLAVYTNHFLGSERSLPLYKDAEHLIIERGLQETEIYGKLNIFIGHDFKNTGSLGEVKTRYEKAIKILEKLAKKGDQSSAFWLQDAKNNLKRLLEEKEKRTP